MINKRLTLLLLDLVIFVHFFLPIFHLSKINVTLTGFQGLLNPNLLVLGNITLWVLLLALGVQILFRVLGWIRNETKWNDVTIMTTNLMLISGLVVVTFLGTYLNWIGIIMIGLIVLGTYLNHKMK